MKKRIKNDDKLILRISFFLILHGIESHQFYITTHYISGHAKYLDFSRRHMELAREQRKQILLFSVANEIHQRFRIVFDIVLIFVDTTFESSTKSSAK